MRGERSGETEERACGLRASDGTGAPLSRALCLPSLSGSDSGSAKRCVHTVKAPPLITKARAALGRLGSNELNELDRRAHKEEKFGELVHAAQTLPRTRHQSRAALDRLA